MYNSESLQIRELTVKEENAESLQPLYPLDCNEIMCKKSKFEDHLMTVSCMELADSSSHLLLHFFLIISLRILLENVFMML